MCTRCTLFSGLATGCDVIYVLSRSRDVNPATLAPVCVLLGASFLFVVIWRVYHGVKFENKVAAARELTINASTNTLARHGSSSVEDVEMLPSTHPKNVADSQHRESRGASFNIHDSSEIEEKSP